MVCVRVPELLLLTATARRLLPIVAGPCPRRWVRGEPRSDTSCAARTDRGLAPCGVDDCVASSPPPPPLVPRERDPTGDDDLLRFLARTDDGGEEDAWEVAVLLLGRPEAGPRSCVSLTLLLPDCLMGGAERRIEEEEEDDVVVVVGVAEVDVLLEVLSPG